MGENYREFWDEALRQIHEDYIKNNKENEFKVWFNMEYIGDTLSEICVNVPSQFFWVQMVKKGYISTIKEKIFNLTGQQLEIVYNDQKSASFENQNENVSDKEIKVEKVNDTVKNSDNSSKRTNSALPTFSALEGETSNQSGNYHSIDKKEDIQQIIEDAKADYDKTRQEIYGKDADKKAFTGNINRKSHPTLNDDYTFEKFVIGDNSDFAYSVCHKAAEDPGHAYNPVLIYGGVGLGKTHLMQSIGNYICQMRGPDTKICYVSTENFTNEFTSSILKRTTQNFKDKYRNLDVLLLDDIHFIVDKKAVQEELFYTFEALYNLKKQLVFTCDRPITEIKGIEDRLKTRFTRGITLDLQPPNYETRLAILKKKLEIKEKSIPEEVLSYIAKNVMTNVRDLEQCLNKMIAYCEMLNKPLTIEIAQKQLRDTFSQASNGSISIETIQKVIADHYNISLSDIKSKKRNKKYVFPRQIAIYIARNLLDYSYPELGNEFGGKDHTTMMHSCEKIEDAIKVDSTLDSTIQMLIREIKDYKK